MNKLQNRTLHRERLSLSSLNVVLTQASRHVPATAQTPYQDVNEERALRLIKMMKLQFTTETAPVASLGRLSEEMAGSDVG
jgi:hypothetical protein